ncbi:MAG: isopeptide-forming domain-containing fimbrial protein, partial [Blautia sp.]|nr:isopeptide-forming domain-containing fimbrial protein [Blautia sp.]
MKNLKKMMALLVAVVMCLAMSVTVFATEGGDDPAPAATGNTVTVQNAKNGEIYNIYKMLDLSVNSATPPTAFRYTINTAWSGFWTTGAGKDYIDTNTSGSDTYVVWKDSKKSASDMEAFGKAAAAYAKANSIVPTKPAVTTATTGTATAEWTGLDNGYYLVTSTYGTTASVASTPANPTQTIEEKNTENTSDKEVQEAAERNGTAATWPEEKANDAAIGDTIQFRSKVSIKKNTTNLVYHDTMTAGLTWSGAATTKVYSDADLTTEIAATNYTVAAGTAPETFTVTFTEDYLASLTAASTDVWIGYTAVLNDAASVTTDQTNTGKITWGNNGQGTPTTTTTKTHKFQVLKYDG